jgi:hypothetical protein
MTLAALLGLAMQSWLEAATVWNGPTMTFTKAGFADPTLPANQDRITDTVWITRGSSAGIYNATSEAGFTHNLSPTNTSWATGSLADCALLTYTNWDAWSAHNPAATVGVDAVAHLLVEDIYLSIRFTSWGSAADGAPFSYLRSSPGGGPTGPAPPVVSGAIAGDTFQLSFTSDPGKTFTVIASPDPTAPSNTWLAAGSAAESPAGSYHFAEAGVQTNNQPRFYRVRWP